jgi:hypothetical protein
MLKEHRFIHDYLELEDIHKFYFDYDDNINKKKK